MIWRTCGSPIEADAGQAMMRLDPFPLDVRVMRRAVAELSDRVPAMKCAAASSLRPGGRPLTNRIDVNPGAVDNRKSAVLILKRQKQIRAAEDHGFRTLLPAHLLPDREEHMSPRIGNAALERECTVAFV